MSVVKRENGDRKFDKVIVDLSSELAETCLNTQNEVAKNRQDFKQKLKYTILMLKSEIDNAVLMSLKDFEEINLREKGEIARLQKFVNEMVSELETCEIKGRSK